MADLPKGWTIEEDAPAVQGWTVEPDVSRETMAPTTATTAPTMGPMAAPTPTPIEPPIPQPRGMPPQPMSRSAAEFGAAAMEGAPFMFGEELGALGSTAAGRMGIPGFSPSYTESLNRARAILESMPRSRRLGGNIAGGLASGLGLGAVVGAPTTTGRLVGLGAVESALAGAGAGETPEQRVFGAAVGAPIGALFGFAVPKTVQGVTNLVSRARSGMTRAESKAANKILQNLERDLIPLDDALQQLKAVEGSTLADIPFARNVLGLARAVESSPGPGAAAITKTLAERQISRPERIRSAIKEIISSQDFGTTQRQLIANRKETANRLYSIARQRGILSSEKLNNFLERPTIKTIVGKLQRDLVDPETGVPLSKMPRNNIRVIDALYKDLVERSFTKGGDPVTGQTGRNINLLRNELRDELSDLAPEYALALEKFSGDKALEEALEAGANAFRGRDRDLVTPGFVKNMSEGEKEQFLIGLARAAQEGIDTGASPVSAIKRLIMPRNKAVIEAATGSKSAAETFTDAMQRELRFAATERAVIGGSPTARIQAERADAAAGALDAALEMGRGNVGQAARGGMDMLLSAMRRGRPAGQLDPGVSEALSRMLTTPVQPESPGSRMIQQAMLRGLGTQRLSALSGLGATGGTMTGAAQLLQPEPTSPNLMDPYESQRLRR